MADLPEPPPAAHRTDHVRFDEAQTFRFCIPEEMQRPILVLRESRQSSRTFIPNAYSITYRRYRYNDMPEDHVWQLASIGFNEDRNGCSTGRIDHFLEETAQDHPEVAKEICRHVLWFLSENESGATAAWRWTRTLLTHLEAS